MNFKMADDHHIRHALPYVACTQGYHDSGQLADILGK